jgi:hypothetical protein
MLFGRSSKKRCSINTTFESAENSEKLLILAVREFPAFSDLLTGNSD